MASALPFSSFFAMRALALKTLCAMPSSLGRCLIFPKFSCQTTLCVQDRSWGEGEGGAKIMTIDTNHLHNYAGQQIALGYDKAIRL